MINIKREDIQNFSKKYNSDPENKKIEEKIKKDGLEKSCINKAVLKENEFSFNIELSETRRYNQKESFRCWMFAGFNMIKRNMAENLNIDIFDFELSNNYLAFFHRLEKANSVYEKIISSKTLDRTKIAKLEKVKYPIEETGNWKSFTGLVKKYGLVPLEIMPNTVEGEKRINVEELFAETVKKNVLELFELKKQNKSADEIRKEKQKMLEENYHFLAKVYGEPKQIFDYEYTNKNGEKVILENITPQKFAKDFLTMDIENFIFISNVPAWGREYGQKFKNTSHVNIQEYKGTEFLNLPIKQLKNLAIKQLKDGIPVMVGISIKKFCDSKLGILDTRLYDYEKMIKYKRLTKEEGLSVKDISLHHWMTITGVQIENDLPKRWKVEDSYGTEKESNGYFVMNDNYFDSYVFTVIIHKKYLSKKQLELYHQKSMIEK